MCVMARRRIEGIEELKGLIGEEIGASDWVVVDQAQIDAFAEATGDRVSVRGDLQPGDRVAVRGAEALEDGETVAVYSDS